MYSLWCSNVTFSPAAPSKQRARGYLYFIKSLNRQELYILWKIVEGNWNDCQSITRSSGPMTAGKREIWRHCHRGNNKKRKMEAGTVVIDSGPQKNEGSAPFIFITTSGLFVDRTLALGMRFTFHVQLPFIRKEQVACSTKHSGNLENSSWSDFCNASLHISLTDCCYF